MSMSFLRPLLILAIAASTALGQSLPIPPYVQPGDGSTLEGSDVKVITWFGEGAQEPYVLEVLKDKKWLPGPAAEVLPIRPSATQEYLRYRVTLTDLPFNSEVNYRVRLLGKIVGGGKVATRKTADQLVRFVVIGDMADGKAPSKKVAWQISQAAPDFIVGAGDIVYSKGLVSEFMSKFWPVYHCTPPG
ncbi:MAG TPA: hypothetical protein VK968_02335, partial [Roseimicrobium sp.]|nr:hypothetical protein [Roseimicrobium sp.]